MGLATVGPAARQNGGRVGGRASTLTPPRSPRAPLASQALVLSVAPLCPISQVRDLGSPRRLSQAVIRQILPP